MKLHWSPRSPFVRKVMIVLHEKGLVERVECVRSPVAMASAPNPDVLRDNPLGKIPTLVLDDGRTLFDSRVICAYLDGMGEGPELLPRDFNDRIETLRLEAFADGLTDVLLLWRIEMARKEQRSQTISDGFAAKVKAALARLEDEIGAISRRPFDLGQVALACTLGQLDFRYPHSGWQKSHPALAAWHAGTCERASVKATAVRDDGALAMGDLVMPLTFESAA